MGKINSNEKQAGVEKGARLKNKLIPLLTLLLVIAITVGIFLYREKVAELGKYGYLGIFLFSLAFNATIVLPIPGLLILFALGATLNPVLVGLAGATGGVIGEMTGYILGYSGRGMTQSSPIYARVEGWMKRWGAMAIFVFAVAPYLPLDIAGMVAGALRFPIWKFFLACWLGKTLKYVAVALAGAWGFEALLPYFG